MTLFVYCGSKRSVEELLPCDVDVIWEIRKFCRINLSNAL